MILASTTNKKTDCTSTKVCTAEFETAVEFLQIKTKRVLTFLLILGAFLIMSFTADAQDVLVGLTSNGGPEGKGTAFSIKTTGQNFSIIKGFADWGTNPKGGFVLGDDGNLYGMTSNGGTFGGTQGYGTLLKVTTAGKVTVLHQFDYTNDGGYPSGELTKGTDGNWYGVTASGGSDTYGTFFRLTPAGDFTVLRNFKYADGGKPVGTLALGNDGDFYGIAYNGGTYGSGTIFKITKTGQFTVLRSLNGTTDGGSSYSSIIQGKDGNFYGMTYYGGTANKGVIYKITQGGNYTVLHSFLGTDGSYPQGDLIQSKDGDLYGMTYNGGTYGHGVIFKIAFNGSYSIIKHLNVATQGGLPKGNLYENSDGDLYGMLANGGANSNGTIFKITKTGTMTVLHALKYDTDGAYPEGNLIKANDGNFYGMATDGGPQTFGTIFKMDATGTFKLINTLHGGVEGNIPYENLALGSDNAYYGLTSNGGKYNFGTIIKICGSKTILLYSFDGKTNGGTPKGSLVLAKDGNFYGMAGTGGANGGGLIFKVTPAGKYSIVYAFKPATDGAFPLGSLIQAADGKLYGMCASNGANNGGTIFQVTTAGAYKVLRQLNTSTDGSSPEGGLVEGTDGFFYGMTNTNGKVFKINANGDFTVLHSFSSSTDGVYPLGSLVFGNDGYLYGTASQSGVNFVGTIFKISTSGSFKVLKSLVAASDGSYPKGDLVKGTDGNFYGMTSSGGTYKAGTIFKITPTGAFSVLKQLNITVDGGSPYGGLIIAPKNNQVAIAQNIVTDEDVTKNIILKGTGTSPFSYEIVTPPTKGDVTQVVDSSFKYAPAKNANGKDSFFFTVNTGCLASAPAKVNVTINPVNDAPVLKAIGNQTVVKNTQLKFKAAATDPDAGQTLSFSLINAPSGAKINASTGAFTYTPTTTGNYTFTVKVTDNASPALSDQETITITVTNTAIATAIVTASKLKEPEQLKATIYPNPVTDKFTVELNKPVDNINARIMDIKGAVINTNQHQLSGNKLSMNASQLKPGMYLLQLQTSDGTVTLKLIKR